MPKLFFDEVVQHRLIGPHREGDEAIHTCRFSNKVVSKASPIFFQTFLAYLTFERPVVPCCFLKFVLGDLQKTREEESQHHHPPPPQKKKRAHTATPRSVAFTRELRVVCPSLF